MNEVAPRKEIYPCDPEFLRPYESQFIEKSAIKQWGYWISVDDQICALTEREKRSEIIAKVLDIAIPKIEQRITAVAKGVKTAPSIHYTEEYECRKITGNILSVEKMNRLLEVFKQIKKDGEKLRQFNAKAPYREASALRINDNLEKMIAWCARSKRRKKKELSEIKWRKHAWEVKRDFNREILVTEKGAQELVEYLQDLEDRRTTKIACLEIYIAALNCFFALSICLAGICEKQRGRGKFSLPR